MPINRQKFKGFRRSQSDNQPQPNSADRFAASQGRKELATAGLILNADDGISEVMEEAQLILSERRQKKRSERAEKIADVLEPVEESNFEDLLDFLKRNVLRANDRTLPQLQAAIDVEVVEAS